jgi:hypothetical protein
MGSNGYHPDSVDFEIRAKVTKVSEDLGLVFGWAIITHEDGQPYFDLQGDHITQKAMLEASTDFALNGRTMRVMHEGGAVGSGVVHLMPLTDEVAGAFGIDCQKRGLMIAVKPDASTLKKFKDGELTGFSIGGLRGEDEEVN